MLGLSEGDGEHELPLGAVVEPIGGEAQVRELAGIQHVNNPPDVHGVPGKPICKFGGVPDSDALLSGLAYLECLRVPSVKGWFVKLGLKWLFGVYLMEIEQITNIAVKVGEAQQKAEFALWVALIAAAGAVVAAFIAGYFKWKLTAAQKEHDKQWAFVSKKTLLIDSAINVVVKMMFNKLAIVYYGYKQAHDNLFILHKEALVLESQFIVYGASDLADAFTDIRSEILNCADGKFLDRWGAIYAKGQEALELCRVSLGVDVTQSYGDFSEKLNQPPAKQDQQTQKIVEANTMGGVGVNVVLENGEQMDKLSPKDLQD